MPEASPERRPIAAELRLAYALPFSAFANGALLAAALAALYLAARGLAGPPLWVLGGAAEPLARDARDVLVAAAAAGFIVGAMRKAVEGNARDLRAAAKGTGLPLLDARPPAALLRRSALRHARVAALVGALGGLALGALSEPYETGSGGGLVWAGLARGALVLLGALLGRAVAFTVATTRDFDRIARIPPALDLVEPAPLYHLGRVGLRLSFTWVVGLTLFSFLTLFGASPGTVRVVAPVLGGIVAVAVLALVLPVRTLRARIRETKREELARLEREIAHLHRAAEDDGAGRDGRIADLCALAARIAGVREWPFEATTLRRFALYLLIPVGSWFAGAFVERLVSAALD